MRITLQPNDPQELERFAYLFEHFIKPQALCIVAAFPSPAGSLQTMPFDAVRVSRSGPTSLLLMRQGTAIASMWNSTVGETTFHIAAVDRW